VRRPVILLALFAFACASASAPDVNPLSGRRDAVLAGEKLFRTNCSSCHRSATDAPSRAPALDSGETAAMSDRELFRFITNGRLRAGMPSWSRLPEERRWQIIAYLRTLDPAAVQRAQR
jgi:mono/diheme cytochrome c family protein